MALVRMKVQKTKRKKKDSPEKKKLRAQWKEVQDRMNSSKLPGRRISNLKKKEKIDPSTTLSGTSITAGIQKLLKLHSDRDVSHIPSMEYAPDTEMTQQVRYTGEMAEREAKAQKE